MLGPLKAKKYKRVDIEERREDQNELWLARDIL